MYHPYLANINLLLFHQHPLDYRRFLHLVTFPPHAHIITDDPTYILPTSDYLTITSHQTSINTLATVVDNIFFNLQHGVIFIIGSYDLYLEILNKYNQLIDKIYYTKSRFSNPNYEGLVSNMLLSRNFFTLDQQLSLLTYRNRNVQELQYLSLIQKILHVGECRMAKIPSLSIFAEYLNFDISNRIPLMTTKKMNWHLILEKLLYNIAVQNISGGDDYINQVKNVIHLLRTDPYTPSIIVKFSGYISAQWYVTMDQKLDCQVYQNCGNLVTNIPTNIVTYAILTHILGYICQLQPRKLKYVMGEAFINKSQIFRVKKQLYRRPYVYPFLVIHGKEPNIEKLTIDHFEVRNYQHH